MCEFTDAIQSNWPNYTIEPGISHDCHICTNGEDIDLDDYETLQIYDEASFSCGECNSCGSTFGGDRFNAHAIHKEAFGPDAKRPDDVHHVDICTDCLMFHANGDLPDDWQRHPST